ncbi:TPA: hypothetical protein RNT09_004634 [Stenotrophomonas maltophilia]|uniref:hypothetical protein n=3 Tax=Stenotrophomonas maltophilia TaxID=40324 RepID=UPI0012F6972C|nr:hypothetical protein [Stenotrophomonas maltophilia]ELE7120735.1 hypothetical protein [Stenotrophomonas maltophilia]HDS3802188.1 hypothetical protein [Stenotrophomonas maltophilia]HDX0826669.1 hypothetical protein [Stenotrophomonas maltophilia]HDX0844121.1 hypothetical protein [Stenotrophomonas maltophilia]HDX0866318.1 hypothetical protein [Stenotrophomonas maltophilia]
MTMVITPEIPRAKDAQDVGFRWVSFTRASPPKVGQFWMRANTNPSNNPEPARPAFFGLVFGLKNGGCQWTFVAFAGMKKGAEAPLFNDLQTSVEVCRS